MKALIWGITGQIGSFMADLLLEKGYQVIGVCRRNSYNGKERIAHILEHPSLTLVDGDITDAHSVNRILSQAKVNFIFNFAAQSQVWTSFYEPSHTFETIVGGTLNCLEWLAQNKAYSTRFYHAGSSEMFGNSYSIEQIFEHGQLAAFEKENLEKSQNENTPFKPCSPYAAAKLAAHNLVDIYRRSYGLWVCSGIMFNSESPRRGSQFVTRKITKWFAEQRLNILNNLENPPKLRLGNVDSVRDWLHAKDTCRAVYAMMNTENPKDYVISSGQARTVRDFVHAVVNKVFRGNINPETLYIGNDAAFLRPNDLVYLKGDSSLINNELKWSPVISFDELVEEMVVHDLYGK